MAKASGQASEFNLRDFCAPQYAESLTAHNALTFKLVKTVADFTQQLSDIHERHAEDLQLLVENFRKRNAEIRKERHGYSSDLFSLWELLLQEVEVDSQLYGDIARSLAKSLGNGLLERSFFKKIQSHKMLMHKKNIEAMLMEAEKLLQMCHSEYVNSYQALAIHNDETSLAEYYKCHNNYVQQLHACNGMIRWYQNEILPSYMEEFQSAYQEVSGVIANAIYNCTDFLASKAREQDENYTLISGRAKRVSHSQDMASFLRTLPAQEIRPSITFKTHSFIAPSLEPNINLTEGMSISNQSILPNEIVFAANNKFIYAAKMDVFRQEIHSLEQKTQQLEETLDSLTKLQQRSLDSSLYNKVNEIQEDISMKRFDLHVVNIRLAALKSQIELLLIKERELAGDNASGGKERKSSANSAALIKIKWLKAFKSLKSSTGLTNDKSNEVDQKVKASQSQREKLQEACSNFQLTQHVFQEYTYKKITPCDVCNQVLRGHSRQGLRCKVCKVNVHINECQDRAPKCQPPKSRILRRQKSSSELEMNRVSLRLEDVNNNILVGETQESTPTSSTACTSVDPVYLLLRAAVEARRTNNSVNMTDRKFYRVVQRARASHASNLLSVNDPLVQASCSAPHSPQRKKMSLRMKSFSLDESNPSVQSSSIASTSGSMIMQPQMPTSQQLLSTGNRTQSMRKMFGKVKMSSMEMHNSTDKSSASTSPCPSPIVQMKPQRLLPTNLYVVLYNFRSRHEDEISLNAGATITVTDTSDPDWWQGKSYGKVGYFPSKYVSRLFSGERPLQMIHTIQLTDGDGNMVKLLRDQIGEQIDGAVKIRLGSGDRTIFCPIQCTQEI